MKTKDRKSFIDISLPTETADGYYMNKSKNEIENFIFIEPEWYKQLFHQNTFYILGPKGSGKTLYAAYMCADIRNNTISKSHTIDVGDYGKLINMKIKNRLDFTAYLTMWKVVLLQKFLFGIDSKEIAIWGRNRSFNEIQNTISNYFGYDVTDDSFNPILVIDSYGKQAEVTNYLAEQFGGELNIPPFQFSLVDDSKMEQKLINCMDNKIEKNSLVYTDTWMRAINEFQKTIKKISFRYNHFLFIDGLDVRPKEIDAREYSECIGALVRAIYDINTKILGNMKRKDNYDFKIVALTRTDIFLNSELVNVTSCINDNCVELDWTYTNEKDFNYSNLYKMMNRLLGGDGVETTKEMPVEKYFDFKLPFPINRPISASMYIQRLSRLRPRDIVVMLRIIQKECKKRKLDNPDFEVMNSSDLYSNYSNYYTDQIKSEMMFNYNTETIKQIFELIKMVKNGSFSESDFKTIFEGYCKIYPSFSKVFPTYQDVLNMWYSLDMIGWMESYEYGRPRMHWHYREVKAIDEDYKLPWEQIRRANNVIFTIHNGTSKNILGTARKK